MRSNAEHSMCRASCSSSCRRTSFSFCRACSFEDRSTQDLRLRHDWDLQEGGKLLGSHQHPGLLRLLLLFEFAWSWCVGGGAVESSPSALGSVAGQSSAPTVVAPGGARPGLDAETELVPTPLHFRLVLQTWCARLPRAGALPLRPAVAVSVHHARPPGTKSSKARR